MDTTAPANANAMARTQNDQPVTQQSVQPTQQAPEPAVTVPAGKETAPIAIPKPEEQWVQETAPEAKISQELQEAGVETTTPEAVQIGPEVAQAGVVATGAQTPIPTEPTIKLPITQEKAQKTLLHKKVKDSLTWLAMLVTRQIQLMQFKKK